MWGLGVYRCGSEKLSQNACGQDPTVHANDHEKDVNKTESLRRRMVVTERKEYWCVDKKLSSDARLLKGSNPHTLR
jgi:hypothetical protein